MVYIRTVCSLVVTLEEKVCPFLNNRVIVHICHSSLASSPWFSHFCKFLNTDTDPFRETINLKGVMVIQVALHPVHHRMWLFLPLPSSQSLLSYMVFRKSCSVLVDFPAAKRGFFVYEYTQQDKWLHTTGW